MKRLGALARTWGPWVVAAAALGFAGREVSLAELRRAFGGAPIAAYVAVAIALLVADLLLESWALAATFTALGGRVRLRELLTVRAATYVVGAIQYYLGQAALLGYLHRRAELPIARAGVGLVFVSLVNFLWLVVLAAVGLSTVDDAPRWFHAAGLGLLAMLGGSALLAWRPPSLLRRSPLGPLLALGLPTLLRLVLAWGPYMLASSALYILTLRWFGVRVPLLHAFVLVPVVLVASALPLSVQGIGLTQVVAVRLLAPFPGGDAAHVLAGTLVVSSVTLLVQIGIGLLALPLARRYGLAGDAPPATEAR